MQLIANQQEHVPSERDERKQKVICQAKQLLMQYQGMTEPEAHRFLQKQAMNLRVSKKSIAETTINYYSKKEKTMLS
ncbi:MAG: ANTAR domain-containing protein [Ruminococcus sp.]|nr:ANTAR domain-containing protein [Ruminococcus sp.]